MADIQTEWRQICRQISDLNLSYDLNEIISTLLRVYICEIMVLEKITIHEEQTSDFLQCKLLIMS
jgi:hypothetical protein